MSYEKYFNGKLMYSLTNAFSSGISEKLEMSCGTQLKYFTPILQSNNTQSVKFYNGLIIATINIFIILILVSLTLLEVRGRVRILFNQSII